MERRPVSASDEFPDYKQRLSTIVGSLLITVGGMSLILNSVCFGIQYGYMVRYIFWSSAWSIATGIVGILASRYRTRRMIRAFLGECCVSVASCVAQTAFAFVAADLNSSLDITKEQDTAVALDYGLAVFGIIGVVFSIVGLVLASRVLCPCCSSSQYQSIGG